MTKARWPGRASAGKAPRSLALWRHSVAAMGDERWEEAIAAFKQFSDNPEPNTNAASVAYQNLSVCYTELERFAEALEMLEIVKPQLVICLLD
jgi:tetratricopeptide (TPR) repeat protein